MGFAVLAAQSQVEFDDGSYRLVRRNQDGTWLLEHMDTRDSVLKSEQALWHMYCSRQMKFIVGAEYQGWKPHISRVKFTPEERALIALRKDFVRAVEGLPISEDQWSTPIKSTWKRIRNTKTQTCAGLIDPEQKRLFQRAWRKLLISLHPPGWITVYRWASRFYACGEDDAALLDKNRGKRDREEIYGSIVLGLCSLAIDELYMTKERETVTGTLNTAVTWVTYEQKKLDAAREKIIQQLPESAPRAAIPERVTLLLPTHKLLQRLIKEIPAFNRYAARYGFDAAVRRFRFVQGRDYPEEPLDMAQLDSTLFDLFVVDDDTWLPLGRPWMTACIDVRTRCILGYYCGFIPPSCVALANCLKDSFLPKHYYKQLYPDIVHEMPFGIPFRLTLDNGLAEHSNQAIEICGRVGLHWVDFCARKKAWHKPEIERWFRTINDDLAHHVPGTTFGNIIEKGDYNPEKFAVVSLSTFRWGVRKWIADVYHTKEHRVLRAEPLAKWQSEIKPHRCRVPHDPAFIDAIVGRPDRGTLTHDGIRINNLRYASPALEELLLCEGPELSVELSVNDENLGKIYVMRGNRILEAQAVDFEYADGITLWQHKKFREFQRETKRPNDPDGWLKAKEEIRQRFADGYVGKFTPRGRARLIDRGEQAQIGTASNQNLPAQIPQVNGPDLDDNFPDATLDRTPYQNSHL